MAGADLPARGVTRGKAGNGFCCHLIHALPEVGLATVDLAQRLNAPRFPRRMTNDAKRVFFNGHFSL